MDFRPLVAPLLAALSGAAGVAAGDKESHPQPPITRGEEAAREAVGFVALGRASLSGGNAGGAILAFEEALRIAPGDGAALDGLAHAWDALARNLRARRQSSRAEEVMVRVARLRTALDALRGRDGGRSGKERRNARAARVAALERALELGEGAVLPSGPAALAFYDNALAAAQEGEVPLGDTRLEDLEAERVRLIREGMTAIQPNLDGKEAERRAAAARRRAAPGSAPRKR